MDSYRDRFTAAVARSRQLGVSPPHVQLDSSRSCLDQKIMGLLEEEGLNSVSQVEKLCNHVSQLLIDSGRGRLRCEGYLTIGDVLYRGTSMFASGMNDKTVRDYVARKDRPPVLDIAHHAWITYPSLEIVDLTIYPFLTADAPHMPEAERDELSKRVVAGPPDSADPDLVFEPVLVGEGFYIECEPNYLEQKRKFRATL